MTLRTTRSSLGRLLAALALAGALLAQPVDAKEPEGAAERITLADARDRARATSPVLAAARASVAAARGEERQAGAFPNPSLVYTHEETSRGGETNREDIALTDLLTFVPTQRNNGSRDFKCQLRTTPRLDRPDKPLLHLVAIDSVGLNHFNWSEANFLCFFDWFLFSTADHCENSQQHQP